MLSGRNENSLPKSIIATCLLGAIGYYLTCYIGYPIKDTTAVASKNWPKTDGKITVSEVAGSHHRPGDPTLYRPRIQYAYQVDGRQYSSEVVAFRGSSREVGSTSRSAARHALAEFPLGSNVPVYYNPQNPAQACLKPGVQVAMGMLLLGLLFFAISLIPAYTVVRRVMSLFGK